MIQLIEKLFIIVQYLGRQNIIYEIQYIQYKLYKNINTGKVYTVISYSHFKGISKRIIH